MALSAGLTANFDTFGPPNDGIAFVPVLHAASTRALILTLVNEFRLSVMRFISHSSYEITHFLVAPVTAFAGQLSLSAGFSPQVHGGEWQRGTLDTVKVHRHAAHARCPSFAARPCLSTCFTSVNALFCSPSLFSAVSTRSRSGLVSVRQCIDADEVLPRVVASGLIVPTAVQNSNQ